MEFFRIKHDIPFMSYGRLTTAISLITFIFSVYFLATKGLNLGVDFTGGTVMEVAYPQAADIGKIRNAMDSIGLNEASVQNFGTSRDVLIRLPVKKGVTSAKLSEDVLTALKKDKPRWKCAASNSSARRWDKNSMRTAPWPYC